MKKYNTIPIQHLIKAVGLALLIALASCKKNIDNSNAINNVLTETLSNIQQNEPVLLAFGNNTASNNIVWQCSPTVGANLLQVGSYVTATFSNNGSYTVTAKDGNKQATFIVNVNNSLYNPVGARFALRASKIQGVAINEKVEFKIYNSIGAANIDWRVTNFMNVSQSYPNDTTGVFSFNIPGLYTITAIDGAYSQSRTISVTSIANAPNQLPFIFTDKLYIVPHLVASGSSKALRFTTNTSYIYKCNTDKVLSNINFVNNNYEVSYCGVETTGFCNAKATASIDSSFGVLPIGLSNFSINYLNQTYTGNVVVDAAGKHTINFTDNNFINIYPKEVQ